MILLLLLIFSISIIFYLLKQNYEYWEKRGVPGPKPRWLVGNVGESFLLKKNQGDIYLDIYESFPNEPLVGAFRATTPILILRDPELVKEITIKSFSDFRDNDFFVDEKVDPIFGKHPITLKGDKWKMVRSQLTPGFTSGKMKWIYPHLEENCNQMIQFIESEPDAFNGKGYEGRDLCSRLTLNNVASCAFGLEGKCFEKGPNEFRQLANDFLSPQASTWIMMYIAALFPTLAKIFPIRLTPKTVQKQLTSMISKTLAYREKNNVVRNDFLHILSQLKKTCKDYEFSDIDVTAHAAGFFGDGYETSAVSMIMILYELSLNPEIQKTLREEVVKKFEENNNTLPYEALQEISLLDAVFCESMRLHPPTWALIKICTNTHTFTPESNSKITKPLTVEKGIPVVIPTLSIHTDPKYFEDPKAFKPERFLGTNKENIEKCTYMPFGEGPRACLGQRFGSLQVKCGIAYILKNYTVSLNNKTQRPLKFDPLNLLLVPVGGVWLNFKKI